MSSSNKFLNVSNSLVMLLFLLFTCTTTACSLNASEKALEKPISLPFKNIGKLVSIGKMPIARTNHIAVKLKDGRVLILGGHILDKNGNLEATKKVQIYDPKTNQFSMTGEMNTGPKYSNLDAVLLKNGKVLVIGEYVFEDGNNFSIKPMVEFYDPSTQKFYQGPSLNRPRSYPALISLENGTAIVFGGNTNKNATIPERSIEVYHPDTNTFLLENLPNSFPKYQDIFTSIDNTFTTRGNIIYFSGLPYLPEDLNAKIPIYEATKSFKDLKLIGELSYLKSVMQQVLVGNDRLVAAGAHRNGPRPLDLQSNTLEVINIATGKNMGVAQYENKNRLLYTLTPLGNQYVLLVGGRSLKDYSTSDKAQVCDIIQLQCYQPMHMPSPRENHTATLLDDGSILILGGVNNALPPKVEKNHLTVNGRHYDRVRGQSEIVSDVLRFYPAEKQ